MRSREHAGDRWVGPWGANLDGRVERSARRILRKARGWVLRLLGLLIGLGGLGTGVVAERVLPSLDGERLTLPEGVAHERGVHDGRLSIRIRQAKDEPLRVVLATVEAPGIEGMHYAVRGQVSYEGVRGDGFLELWSHFPPKAAGQPEARYFSRTLGDTGEMGRIRGTSAWRRFELPFDRTGSPTGPSRLEVALVLPGAGVVEVSGLELVDFGAAPGASLTRGWDREDAWWRPTRAGWLGGVVGTVGGVLGAVMGVMMSRKRARGWVLGLLTAMGVSGLAMLLACGVALWQGQPVWVWSPLLLCGGLSTVIPFGMIPGFRKAYAEVELRRIRAMDESTR